MDIRDRYCKSPSCSQTEREREAFKRGFPGTLQKNGSPYDVYTHNSGKQAITRVEWLPETLPNLWGLTRYGSSPNPKTDVDPGGFALDKNRGISLGACLLACSLVPPLLREDVRVVGDPLGLLGLGACDIPKAGTEVKPRGGSEARQQRAARGERRAASDLACSVDAGGGLCAVSAAEGGLVLSNA